jgi:hemolysin activation/secretion protein
VHKHRVAGLAACLLLYSAGAVADNAPPVAAAQAQPRFDIYEFRVLGNTVLSARDVEGAVYAYLGPGKNIKDVEAVRATLENLYHARGYGTVFVDIPPQDVVDNIVRLRVTEGRVARTKISGARYFSEGKILAALPEGQPGGVPNIPILQAELAQLNSQTSDRTVVPVLKAGSEPGTMDLDLKVNDRLPLHGSVELNNEESAGTPPLRATFALNYDDFLAQLDNLAFQYQDSPEKPGKVRLIAANYTFHPIWGGFQPSLLYIDSSSNVAAVGTLGVIGKGQIYGARLTYPMALTQGLSEALTLGLDYKHFGDTVNVDATTALQTPVYYLNGSVAYLASWRSDASQETLNLSANFGPRGLASNSSLEFENKRFEGRGNYFYMRADGTWIRNLPWGFQGLLRAAGQYTAEPLISNENYSIGGIDGVRGYLEAEDLGDSAIKGTAQLRSPQWGHWKSARFGDLFVFYDTGVVYELDPLPGEASRAVLRSWGAGIDLIPGGSINAFLLIAHPLTSGAETHADAWRVLFSIRGAF